MSSVTTTSRRAHRTVAPGCCWPKFTPTSPNGLGMAASVPGRGDAFGPKISWDCAGAQGGGPKPTTSDEDAGAGLTDDAGAGLADDLGAGSADDADDGTAEEDSGEIPDSADTDPGAAQPPTIGTAQSIAMTATVPPVNPRLWTTQLGRPIRRNGSLRRKVERCLNLPLPRIRALRGLHAPKRTPATRRPPSR